MARVARGPVRRWGASVWYLEIDDDGYPARQLERYEHGPVLKYDAEHMEDEYGALGDQPIDRDEFSTFEVAKEEFEDAWAAKARWTRSPWEGRNAFGCYARDARP